ncbi:MAG: arabinogalactan endo-1,4-beta-galactosidase [Algoriphagus sp.]|jgi:arabinogalactan endo-1,4-beta-galactosidase
MITTSKNTYQKEELVGETGYPYSADSYDESGNILNRDGGLNGHPINPSST